MLIIKTKLFVRQIITFVEQTKVFVGQTKADVLSDWWLKLPTLENFIKKHLIFIKM